MKSKTISRFVNRGKLLFNQYFLNGGTENYQSLVAYDDDGKEMCVPLIVTQGEELRMYGYDGYNRYFSRVVSLIASPGQGKSRLATAIYNEMRGDSLPYFKISDSAVSFTKGVWRLSDEHKLKLLAKDHIDILDVEGLQKENKIYYLLIAVTVLSQTVVFLSRERVNKEALGIMEIAFKILGKLGIKLNKPVLFIQTKINAKGELLDGDKNAISKSALIKSLEKEMPIINEFQAEFFGLREVPDIEVLRTSAESIGLPDGAADRMFETATELYKDDVRDLLRRLKKVKDTVSAEHRMHYLMLVVEHINNNNPDLVLEQNLEFFAKDAKRWLDAAVLQEKESLLKSHRHKPLGTAQTLEEFFDPPRQKLLEKFMKYCEDDSPFMVDSEKHKGLFKRRASAIFQDSTYAKSVLKAKDPATGKVIGIMSYIQPDFEAKRKTAEGVLTDVFVTLKTALESSISDMFSKDVPTSPPRHCVLSLKQKYSNVAGIDEIIRDRWQQVCSEHENRRDLLVAESKWLQKCKVEGCTTCPSCHKEHEDGITHKHCKNPANVPTVLWYWIKNTTQHAICNGCEDITKITAVCCYTCGTRLPGTPIPPQW